MSDKKNELFDIDGDGKASPKEIRLCQLCLMGALAVAFGDKVLAL